MSTLIGRSAMRGLYRTLRGRWRASDDHDGVGTRVFALCNRPKEGAGVDGEALSKRGDLAEQPTDDARCPRARERAGPYQDPGLWRPFGVRAPGNPPGVSQPP